MRYLLSLAAALGLVAATCSSAVADKRVALVIGNSAYRNVPALPNPTNDASAVADLLKSAHFDSVQLKLDVGVAELRHAVSDFTEAAADADIAVVYYAGHGMEIDGTNYVIPVDARLARDFDVDDETMSLDRILRAIEPARQLRLVILDACRDNPFLKTMKRTIGSRSIGRGLAKVEPTASDTLVAFAAKAGSTAFDGQASNSPFTTALLHNIATPGLDIRLAFGRVRDEVMAQTGQQQEPFVYGSLGGKTVSIVTASTDANAPTETPAAANRAPVVSEAAQAWAAAKDTTSTAVLEAFIAHYGDSFYAELARDRLKELKAKAVVAAPPVAAPPPAPAPSPSKSRSPSRSQVALDCGADGTGVGKSDAVFTACQHRKYSNCKAWKGALCLRF